MHTRMHKHNTHTFTHTPTQTCIYAGKHAHARMHAPTHSHTQTHAHAHTLIHTCARCDHVCRYGDKQRGRWADRQTATHHTMNTHSFANHINSNCYSISILIPITSKLTVTDHLIDNLMYSPHLASSAVDILTPSGCGLGMVTLYSKLHGSNNLCIVI